MEKYISVDERMVATKTQISLKQYVKSKPTKWGYKLFVLADSNSGYTWNFCVHKGRSAGSGKGLSYEAVMLLVDFDARGSGYEVYVTTFIQVPNFLWTSWKTKLGPVEPSAPTVLAFQKQQ